MKSIKIILGIVTALVLVFFLTGIIITQVEYSTEIEVNKPVATVFENFKNVDQLKKWLPDVKSIEPKQEKPGVLGSTYNVIVENNGQEVKMVQRISDYIENEKITFEFHSNQMVKTTEYNFIANGNTTKIVQNSSVNSKSYMTACLYPYFKGTFKKISLLSLKKCKEYVEK
ncbi:SRPBCC family protein [Tenacibaculum finnmarkense]|uniref:SRPBCC family protein n=1 Tax=Tenacibaculum finnmarkense TaxID=2781243 RepID=UPI001EFB45EA|nr:SRPBCC family protein [Tenacibaculum finnmarkense]MCG8804701.1 SRPBCC family protein [Tenacibaculum finnmarkense]MCG8856465.1 SRPBCC family protein [Tenacibaculum finnmarkense]WCC45447.1 SRPBCC family protein [Tenacibaculum finnmarkense]